MDWASINRKERGMGLKKRIVQFDMKEDSLKKNKNKTQTHFSRDGNDDIFSNKNMFIFSPKAMGRVYSIS